MKKITTPSLVDGFDCVPERRGSGSLKWDLRPDPDLLPMWVADMDFPGPPAVLDALQARVEHGVFGYTYPPAGLEDRIAEYVMKQYAWNIDPAWLVWFPGLVPALHAVTQTCTSEGDSVAIPSPVYPPFFEAPRSAGRTILDIPFLETSKGWVLDLDGVENAAKSGARLMLFCNPHNPLGKVIREDELKALAEISETYGMVICSDEVHCDLILDDLPHRPLASLGESIASRTITLMAASKTFNIAGLGCAFAIVSDPQLRKQLTSVLHGITGEVNPLGYTATDAAFAHGEPWRQTLLTYLRRNRNTLEQHILDLDSPVRMHHVEATYLAWLDIRGLKQPQAGAHLRKAGLWLSASEPFGAEGFLRMNFACPHERLLEGLNRLDGWVKSL